MNIAAWLDGLGLKQQYEEAFRSNHIDRELLVTLTWDDLREMGVASVGHRKRLLAAIAALTDAIPSVPGTVAELGAAPPPSASAHPPAERRQLTVMFIDLVGSTELSRALDPEEMGEILRAYQNVIAGELARFEGHVARFMGDGVLAYFGWPRAHENDAECAIRAGLATREAVGRVRTPAGEPLQARVGIATGLVVVGELVGEGAAREEVVVGETPNLAARLQALAEPGAVVVAQGTRQLVGGLFEYDDLGNHQVKGFSEPLQVWRVLGPGRAEGRFEALHDALPMVGREQEIALLLDRWQLAKEGEGQVALLSGEPGIGKSRIVLALRERLRVESLTSLGYHGSPYHTNSTLWPVVSQIERAAGFVRDEPPATKLDKLEALLGQAVAEPAEAASLIAEFFAIPTKGRYSAREVAPQERKAEIFQALLAQLEGLAVRGPILIVLEDAHWVDPTTLELFDIVVERIARLPVLLVITFRPDFRPLWTVHPHATLLTLNRLSARQAAAIVEHVTAGRMLPKGILERVVAKADGVPLFLEELAKAVIETNPRHNQNDRYDSANQFSEFAVPASLHDSLMARLDRLALAREVAQAAAVIGREFGYGLLAAITDIDKTQLHDALDQLVAVELIFRRNAPSEVNYIFKHALVRDAAYGSLLKHRRQQIHARIAEVLEARYPEITEAQPGLVAQHYASGGVILQASRFYLAAGRRAAAHAATTEALGQFGQGLALLKALGDIPERWCMVAQLRLALARATRAAKGAPAAETLSAFRQAREACERADDFPGLVHASYGEFLWYYNRAELNSAREAAARLLRLGAGRSQDRLSLVGHLAAGLVAYFSGDFPGARGQLKEIPSADRRHANDVLGSDNVVASLYLASTLLILGFPEQALARCRQALDETRHVAQPNTTAVALGNACIFHYLRRDFSALHATALRLEVVINGREMSAWPAVCAVFRGWTLAWGGLPDAGIALLQGGLEAYQAIGYSIEVPLHLAVAADALVAAKRIGDAKLLVMEALEHASRTGESWLDAELHRLAGRLALLSTPPDRGAAQACFKRALEVAHGQGALLWELRAAASLVRLKCGEAREILATVYGQFTEGFSARDLKHARALLSSHSLDR